MSVRDRYRSRIVLFAILGVVLAISAAPVMALQTNTGVVINTTDTDFQNAAEVSNLLITGSGDSASVEGWGVDDFEDGDINIESPTWSGWSGDTGSFTADSSEPISGSFSGNLTASNENIRVTATRSSVTTSNLTVTVNISEQTGTAGDRVVIDLAANSDPGALIFQDGSGNIEWFNGSVNTITPWSPNTDYTVTFDFDFPNDQVDIYINDTPQGTFDLQNSVSGWDQLDIQDKTDGSGSTRSVLVDDFNTGDTGTYIAEHAVDNAQQGFTDLTLSDAEATVTWQEHDGTSWNDIRTDTYTSSGNKSVDISSATNSDLRVNVTFVETGASPTAELADDGVTFTNHEPQINNGSASPTGDLSQAQQTLSIDANDTEFGTAQGDSVDVEFFVDGSSVGSDTITSNGTASVSHTFSSGDHNWHAVATDSHGLSNTSDTFTVTTPENITIRNVSEPHDIVEQANVEILITGSDETVDRQTISDGNISLEGLATDEEYIVIVNATDYYRRSIIVEDVFEQSDVFILNESFTGVETAIQIDDPTGEFPPGDSQLIVQKVINRSLYDGSEPKEYQWTTIGGDRLGADQEYVVILKEDDRYRFIVTNDDGDRRVLGEYSATSAKTVVLSIENIDLVIDEANPLSWNATQENVSGTETIKFRFNDSEDETTDLTLKIYERGNESNEIENTTHAGPFGLFTHDEQLTDDQAAKTWVVEWSATRDGETIGGKTVAGQDQDPLVPDLDGWLKGFIAVGSVIFIGFAAGGIRMEAGAVLAALLSAVWWYIGFMPPEVTGGMIALAMAVSMSVYARGGRRV